MEIKMSKMKVSVPHNLGEGEAVKRVSGLITELKNQFGSQVSDVRESWDGNRGIFSFRAMGMSVDGELSVLPSKVEVEGNLPLAALPFKGTIESTIRNKLENLLS